MSTPTIIVNNLSKSYRLGVIGRQTLQDEIRYWWHKVRGRNPLEYMGKIGHPASSIQHPVSRIQQPATSNENPNTFWALKDISFEVEQGEVLGIIGKNGAGKSTLLKILTRITEPTSGTAIINGRVASLLEVGTGFHPELTGRENIFLNGSILGMKKDEITSKFDGIVDFADIEKFLDTPVKRYSSGMYVRLAFAVAAHLEPEILLVDEVLAVGDAEFQKKCLGKMQDVAEGGRTVLFVSHNMPMVTSLCNNAISLKSGVIQKIGGCSEVVIDYLRSSGSNSAEVNFCHDNMYIGDNLVRLLSGKIISDDEIAASEIDIRKPFSILMEYEVLGEGGKMVPNFHVKTVDGHYVFATSDDSQMFHKPGKYKSVCVVPGYLLNDGTYSIGLAVSSFDKKPMVHFFEQNSLTINIKDPIDETRTGYRGRIPGVVRPKLQWNINRLS